MTTLCAIPGCRLRGRHLPGCVDDQCAGCLPRATDDGLVCDVDLRRAGQWLAEIIALAPDARAVAAGLVRRGHGGGSGKPDSRPPLNDGATDALDEVVNAVTTIARDIAETRGLHIDSAAFGDLSPADPLTRAAKWLSGQMDWLRHATDDQGGAYAAEVFAELRDCASKIRGIVDGPSESKYLGPCGAVHIAFSAVHDPMLDTAVISEVESPPCEGDVYGRPGAAKGRCRTCGAEVATDERRAWLDEQARASDLAWTAKGIADAYGINPKTIRAWATDRYSGKTLIRRAKLSTYWRNPDGQLVPWVEPRQGEDVKARGDRLHYVADVVELEQQAAAERERRAAGKAEEPERMSA